MKVRRYEILHDAVRLYPYRGEPLDVPFARMKPRPTRANPIEWMDWDRDIGRHGPAYRLRDGSEGAVLWEHALSVNNDPDYVARMAEHALRAQLQGMLKEASQGRSLRELAKLLHTSPSQVQRLLAPGKGGSLAALTQALAKLGVSVELRKAS